MVGAHTLNFNEWYRCGSAACYGVSDANVDKIYLLISFEVYSIVKVAVIWLHLTSRISDELPIPQHRILKFY